MHIEGDGPLGVGNWGHTQEALRWFCLSAAGGNPLAEFAIGEIFDQGYVINTVKPGGMISTTDVPMNKSVAMYWYLRSAGHRYTRAMLRIADYYIFGSENVKGTPVHRDVGKAVGWETKAALAGDTDAALELATAYAPGIEPPSPLPKNATTALKWFTLAQARLAVNKVQCTSREAVRAMIAQLPDPSIDPSTVRATIATARRGFEVVCVLYVGPPDTSNDSAASEIVRAMSGGNADSWSYLFEAAPNGRDFIVYRATLVQAVGDALREMVVLQAALAKYRKNLR